MSKRNQDSIEIDDHEEGEELWKVYKEEAEYWKSKCRYWENQWAQDQDWKAKWETVVRQNQNSNHCVLPKYGVGHVMVQKKRRKKNK